MVGWEGGKRCQAGGSPLQLPSQWEGLQHTPMPQFPHLAVGRTAPFDIAGALWLLDATSAMSAIKQMLSAMLSAF